VVTYGDGDAAKVVTVDCSPPIAVLGHSDDSDVGLDKLCIVLWNLSMYGWLQQSQTY